MEHILMKFAVSFHKNHGIGKRLHNITKVSKEKNLLHVGT